MPSDDELKAYAKDLPEIYRDILEAFPESEPGRKAGYGLAFYTLAAHFVNTGREHSLEEVQAACMQLAKGGFFEIKNQIFAHPTELGERLIAAVTGGEVPSKSEFPPLPIPTW
jgi:hypothetical protein